MKLNNLSILTVSFNNNLLTGMMLKSFQKQVGELPEVVIVDNGDKIPVDNGLKSCFNVIDNFQNKLLSKEANASRNHAKAIDYALKNCIKTKWVLLVDNDILFYPRLSNFIRTFNDAEWDTAGEIGYDYTPPDRIFPYLNLINVDKFNKERRNYYDEQRIILDWKKSNKMDTGYSFFEDIKNEWKIYQIKLSDFCIHLKSGSLWNKNIKQWLTENKELF